MEFIKEHCNNCSSTTNHDQLFEDVQYEAYPSNAIAPQGYSDITTYRLLRCRGCESIRLHVEYENGLIGDFSWSNVYPPRISRRPPAWKQKLNSEIRSLLDEVYTALHADSRRLAMMGARAIVDVFMNLTVGDVGGFNQKLNALSDKGYISSIDHQILASALEAGHAAAHRGHNPSPSDVNHVMDIVENLLHKGVLRLAAISLSNSTPKRVKGKKS